MGDPARVFLRFSEVERRREKERAPRTKNQG